MTAHIPVLKVCLIWFDLASVMLYCPIASHHPSVDIESLSVLSVRHKLSEVFS